MIACTENCKYQKNGECTCEQTTSNKKNSFKLLIAYHQTKILQIQIVHILSKNNIYSCSSFLFCKHLFIKQFNFSIKSGT